MNRNFIYLGVFVVIVSLFLFFFNDKGGIERGDENLPPAPVSENFRKITPSEIEKASAEFIENYLREAIEVYNSGGLDALVDGEFKSYIRGKGGTFLYIVSEDLDLVIFNLAFRETMGLVASKIRNPDNVYIYKDVIFPNATEEGQWVEYSYLDPVDTKVKKKKDYIIKSGDYIFGAGIYPIR